MAYPYVGQGDPNALAVASTHTHGPIGSGQHHQNADYQTRHPPIVGQEVWNVHQQQLQDPSQTIAHSGVTMSGQPAAQMQDGGVVLMDSYGNQTGYWPPPLAPRLTAAAPRGGMRNLWGSAWSDSTSGSAYMPAQPRMPWAADGWNHLPSAANSNQSGYYQNQGVQHQHQALLHEQLRKLQHDANALSQQQHSHAQPAGAWTQASDGVVNPAFPHANSQFQAPIPTGPQPYPPPSHALPQSAQRPDVDANHDTFGHFQRQPRALSSVGSAYHLQPSQTQPDATDLTTAHADIPGYPVSRQGATYPTQWAFTGAQLPAPQNYQTDYAVGYGASYDPRVTSQQGAGVSQHADAPAALASWNRPLPAQWQVQPDVAQQAHLPPSTATWNGITSYDPRRGSDQQVANVPAPPPSAEQQPLAPPADGPAPPSPGTLDKSSCPLSAMGAEIVWGASAALFDTALISMQYEKQQQRGRTTSSAQSSPMLSTPSGSPSFASYASWVNGDPRQGPATHTSDSLDMNKSPHHRAWNTGLVGDLGTAPVSLLHRLAVEGAGAANAALTTTHNAGASQNDTGTSSTGSTSSTSEPGTPPPIVDADAGGVSQSPPKNHVDVPVRVENRSVLSPSAHIEGDRASKSSTRPSSGLPSTRQSADRSTQAIVAVLTLVSPTWKWSVNDDKLLSVMTPNVCTRQGNRDDSPSAKHMTATRTRRSSSTYSSRHAGHAGAMPGADVSPAFRRFCQQVLAQTLLSPTAFLLAILYAVRVPYLFLAADGSLCDEGREIFANPPSAAPFKLFTLGLMLSNKVIEDNTFLNKTWCDVTGIPLAELNRMESVYLAKCSYEVAVPHAVWVAYLRRIRTREEQKLNVLPFRGPRRLSRGRMSAGSPTSQDQALQSPSGAPNSLESSRRFLVAIEDCLAALGELHEAVEEDKETIEDHNTGKSFSDVLATRDTMSPSSNGWFPPKYAMDPRVDVGRMQRPTAALQAAHQHCRSAPAAALDFHASLQTSPTTAAPSLDDVFADDDSPIRPRDSSSRGTYANVKVAHPLAHAARPSLDVNLTRSHSDWSDGLAGFARVAPTHLTTAPGRLDSGAISQITSRSEAPLAPGILLAMLNQL